MDERTACAWLKSRFEAAGLQIEQNLWFEAAGVRFEIDGYDAGRRVGYEYVTQEAGDSWDVDADVIARLAALRDSDAYFILVVSETEAPDLATLQVKAEAFLAGLPPVRDSSATARPKPAKAAIKPAAKKPAAKKPAAKKPAAKKQKRR